jgi:subtilisin family serine protease/N-acetylneuraminic acid mutarotase
VKAQASLVLTALLIGACQDATDPGDSPRQHPAQAASRVPPGEIIPGQYIVVFRDAVNDPASVAKKLATKHRGKLRHTYKAALKGMAVELPDAAVAALRQEPEVAYVEPNQIIRLTGGTVVQPNVTHGLDRIDQRALPLNGSYSYAADGSGVRVYLIDTGIYYDHTDFGGRAFFEQDMVGGDGWNEGMDCNGHGTHVAGTIGGALYGVAKKVTFYSVRVLNCQGVGELFYLTSAIDWITEHRVLPAVANLSVGTGFSQAINDAVARSTASGITYVAAAGNSRADACNFSPASAPSAITVAAADSVDAFDISFSNWGSCVDLEAPGDSVTSDWLGGSNATARLSGTSMAAPHVTGAAALYLSTAPNATPAQVTAALTGNATLNALTAVPAGTVNRLLYTGFLLPPPASAWISRASLLAARSVQALGQVNGRLYALGGRSNGSLLRSIEEYNPTLDRWSSKAPMPAARSDGSGTAAINGVLYLAGGMNGSGIVTKTLYAYSVAANSWSTKAPLPTPSGCGGTGVISGQLYVLTGCSTRTGSNGLLHRYTPSTNAWAARTAAPAAHRYPAVGVIGGKLYVAGGKNVSGQPTATLHVYTPGTNSWVTKTAMPSARFGAAGQVINGKLYVIGGTGPAGALATTLVYDPVANSWSTKAPMPTPRSHLAVQTVGGLLFAVGGRSAAGDLRTVERFSP